MGEQPTLRYAPGLDGVRGLAVAAVVVFHAAPPRWLPGGFLGVSLFFTLSGYLIGSLLLVEIDQGGRVSLAEFWARRVRRLVPALLVTLAAIAMLAHYVRLPERTGAEIFSGLTYSSNWYLVGHHHSYVDLFQAPSALSHLWSLAIEEQFYVIFPIVVWLLARRLRPHAVRRALAAGAITAVAISAIAALLAQDHDLVYYGTHTRAGEIAAGVLLAVLLPANRARRSTAAAWLAAGVTVGTLMLWRMAGIDQDWLYRGGLAGCALASMVLINAAVRPGWFGRAVGCWPLRQLGRLSYGLYLVHWPVVVLLSPARTHVDGARLFVLRVAMSLSVAVACFVLVERPVRQSRRGARRTLALGGGVLGVAAVATALLVFAPTQQPTMVIAAADHRAAVAFAHGDPTPPARTVVPARVAPATVPADAGPSSTPRPTTTATTTTATTLPPPPPSVAMLGDSVLAWLILHGEAALTGVHLIDGTLAGCDGYIHQGIEARAGDHTPLPLPDECGDWTAMYPPVVEDQPVDAVVLMTSTAAVLDHRVNGHWRSPCDAAFQAWYGDDLGARIDYLLAHVPRVVVVEPSWYTDNSRWITPQDHQHRSDCVRQIFAAVLATRPAARLVDLAAYVCPGGPSDCLPIRPDGMHFDPGASAGVLRWLLDQALA